MTRGSVRCDSGTGSAPDDYFLPQLMRAAMSTRAAPHFSRRDTSSGFTPAAPKAADFSHTFPLKMSPYSPGACSGSGRSNYRRSW
jgi:hypothetical protein